MSFESGSRKVIPAVLIYARHEGRILLIHRTNPEDFHFGKWNGLGGKCEVNESPLEAAQREFLEESGLDLPLSRFKPLGVVQFPNFKPAKHEDWVVFIFKASVRPEEAVKTTKTHPEGGLHWVNATEILSLNSWPGDRSFLPLVLQEIPFMGTIWYEGNEVKRIWIQELSQEL